MKKILLIFIVSLIVSCKSDAMKSANEMEVASEAVGNSEDSKLSLTIGKDANTFTYKALTTEKLQEYLDLIALQQKHPEFEESIESQLKNYTYDSVSDYKKLDEPVIQKIELKDEIITINDSTQKMKLVYTLISRNTKNLDSIWAKITRKTVIIDGKEIQSKKVKFQTIK